MGIARGLCIKFIDAWKHHPVVLLVTALRNRVQHGGALEGIIKVEALTPHQPIGSAGRSRFHVSDIVWSSAIDNIPEKDRIEAKRFYEISLAGQPQQLDRLLATYESRTKLLVDQIVKQVDALVDPELQRKRDELRAEHEQVLREMAQVELGPLLARPPAD